MTTIAYRNGVLAADSAVTWGDVFLGTAQKLFRGPTNGVLGFSGDLSLSAWAQEWAEEHDFDRTFLKKEWDTRSDGAIIWVKPDLTIWAVFDGATVQITAPFAAIGSGRDLALGAMAAGADAVGAISIACGLDTKSKHPVRFLEVNPAPEDTNKSTDILAFPKQ